MSRRAGIHAWYGYRSTFADRLAKIRDAGFGATALWWEEDRDEIRRLRDHAPDLVRRAGLHLDSLHAPYRGCDRLWSEKEADRTESLAEHLRWIADCRRHEVPILVMHVTMGTRAASNPVHGRDSIRRLADAAVDAGVTLALENTRRPELLEGLFDAIDAPGLALCYDSSHDWLYGHEPPRLLRRFGARLAATHLSDTDGRRDLHALPGTGTVNFAAIAEALPENYAGTWMLEVMARDPVENEPAFLRRAYEALSMLDAGASASA